MQYIIKTYKGENVFLDKATYKKIDGKQFIITLRLVIAEDHYFFYFNSNDQAAIRVYDEFVADKDFSIAYYLLYSCMDRTTKYNFIKYINSIL